MTDVSESAVRVVVSPSLSEGYDRRYVVVDAATGEVIDDSLGYGYKTAQNAHPRLQVDVPTEETAARHRQERCPSLVREAL